MPDNRRRPGRPALAADDPSVDVHVRIPSRDYDVVYTKAQACRVSVPELLRRGVKALTEFKTSN
jgi:hypothetical protein